MNRQTSFSDILLPTCSPQRQAIAMPALVIVEQQSLHKESFTKDGEQKVAHNVVKNTPFVIKVTITNSLYEGMVWDFNRLTVEASLLYDCWEEKPVPYLKNKPIQYQGKVNDTADTMTLNTKINVLSSHCENMMFRVKLQAIDAKTNEACPSLVAFSEPIKVISKPDQLPNCKSKKQASATTTKAKPKKRTINDVITESLEKIQDQQREHQELLLKLYEEQSRASRPAALPIASFDELSSSIREAQAAAIANGGETDKASEDENALEKAFHNFLDVYNKLNAEQRPEKIRRIVRNASARKTETFCEIVGLFNDEGLQKELGRECSLSFSSMQMDGTGQTDGCHPDACPHKKELERIDEFYRDFLAAPSLSLSSSGGDTLPLPMLFNS